MPIVSQEINETVETVTRPVVFAVARNILQRTGIDIDADIYLNKGDGQARSLNSGIREKPSEAKFDQGTKIKISMEEEHMDYGLLENTVPNSDHPAIFHDKALDIWIQPIYHNTRMILSFEMYFNSESAANNWVNGIRRRIGNERQHQRHTADYHFPVPTVLMSILANLYTTREARAGYGDTFGAYLKQSFVERVTVMTNQSASASNFSVKESQTGMNGWYSFDRPPQAVQNTQQFSASFTYTFEFSKPTAFTMGYPLLVHNQLIPAKLRIRGENFNELVDPMYASNTKTRYDRLSGGEMAPGQSIGGVSIPAWDEWLPSAVRGHYSTLLRIMVAVEEDDKRSLVDLDKLGTIQIDPMLRDYMAKYHDKLNATYQNVFHVCLYRDDKPLSEDAIFVDEHLFVSTTFDMDDRHNYHLWIGCMVDLSNLNGKPLEDLLEDGETTKKVIEVVDSDYPVDTIPVLDDGTVSETRWNQVKVELKESEKHFRNRVESNTLTVGRFAITASNRGRN